MDDPLSTRGRGERPLAFLGRHSLIIYLAHQPLLFGFFTALAVVAPPPGDSASFIAACERRCADEGGETQACRAICGCTAREVYRTRTLDGAADDAERGRRINAIARGCAAARK
jgi:uncharacterized membrane protein